MKKIALVLATVFAAAPAFAQDAAAHVVSASVGGTVGWVACGIGLMMGLAVLGGTFGQARAAASALDGIARNPAASDKITVPLILSLALMESLVLFAFLIAFFLQGASRCCPWIGKISVVKQLIPESSDSGREKGEPGEGSPFSYPRCNLFLFILFSISEQLPGIVKVSLFFTFATRSGVPFATISPPPVPPSGPRSITWSTHFTTSILCSMTTTVFP